MVISTVNTMSRPLRRLVITLAMLATALVFAAGTSSTPTAEATLCDPSLNGTYVAPANTNDPYLRWVRIGGQCDARTWVAGYRHNGSYIDAQWAQRSMNGGYVVLNNSVFAKHYITYSRSGAGLIVVHRVVMSSGWSGSFRHYYARY